MKNNKVIKSIDYRLNTLFYNGIHVVVALDVNLKTVQ